MIPTQTLESFPIFGSNATKVEPGDAKKAAGWQQADVVPAEWMNWEWYKASKGITELNAGVNSIESEMNSVLTAAGITPAQATNNQLLTSIMKIIHPVGTLWWTSKAPNDGGDPNVLFGGTWTQIKDRFVLAAGDTYTNGATGGAATVTLTVNQMPSHSHTGVTGSGGVDHVHNIFHRHYYGGTSEEAGIHEHNYSGIISSPSATYIINDSKAGVFHQLLKTSPLGNHTHNYSGYTNNAIYQNDAQGNPVEDVSQYSGTASVYLHTHTISAEGGGGAHNNMPPYIVKYCWERTA